MPSIISSIWGDWLWFAAAAFGIVTTLVALVYVISGFLMNEKMKTWAKMELAEIFYSAVIIAVAIGGITTMDNVVQGALGVSNLGGTTATTGSFGSAGQFQCLGTATSAFVPVSIGGVKTYKCMDICGEEIARDQNSIYNGVPSCHMRLGMWYLSETFEEAKNFAFDIYVSYIKTSFVGELTINIEYFTEYAGFFTFNPWRGFVSMPNKVKELCFDWAMKLMMLCKFQEVLLRYVAVALFPALFVIGALLRTFTFTRRLGGLLLAMAIALYFFFPAFYAFGALVMFDLKSKAYDSWMHNDKANPVRLSGPLAGSRVPDPPISNTMYINGNVPTLGGGSTTEDLKNALMVNEGNGLTSPEFLREIENGQKTGILPSFDLNSNTQRSDDEVRKAMEDSRRKGDNFIDTVSKEGKYDDFITSVWTQNGPLDVLARITFWSLFFGLFSIIGTIGIIRSLSITFGGDIEIAGLTRLI